MGADEMDSALNLLDELEDLLDNSKAVPFSNKVHVNKEDLYSVIAEIRAILPNDIKQSKFIVQERSKILLDAQKEAEEITRGAEEKVERLINEHEVTRAAYARGTEIIENSKKSAREMRIGATEYADEVLAVAEERLRQMMENLRKESINIDAFFNESLNVIRENRQELRGLGK
ncbi:MAG: hypothetical protein ACRCW1_11375 [Anaerotignaceae bacterium]